MIKYIVTAFVSTIYTVLFCLNVQSIASQHLDNQVAIPFLVIALSVIAFIIALVTRLAKRARVRIYFIPAMLFLAGLITLIVGSNTPCCIGG